MASSGDDGSDAEYITPRGVPHFPGHEKRSNTLPFWGSERTMNLNPLILTNIQTSHYFKSKFLIVGLNYLYISFFNILKQFQQPIFLN